MLDLRAIGEHALHDAQITERHGARNEQLVEIAEDACGDARLGAGPCLLALAGADGCSLHIIRHPRHGAVDTQPVESEVIRDDAFIAVLAYEVPLRQFERGPSGSGLKNSSS